MIVVLFIRESVFRDRGCLVRFSVFRGRRVSRNRFRGMNRATELIASHHVTEREKDAAQKDNAEKQSYEMPTFQHPFATTAASISCHRLYSFLSTCRPASSTAKLCQRAAGRLWSYSFPRRSRSKSANSEAESQRAVSRVFRLRPPISRRLRTRLPRE